MSKTKLIHGVGINDADYPIRKCCYYKRWKLMLRRCYSAWSLKDNPSYKGCKVDKEWHSFMAFRSWMITQDWQGKCLDKDIIIPGNRVYGPKACLFVSSAINSLLVEQPTKRGKCPNGVTFREDRQKFVAVISIYGRNRVIGRYDNQEDAREAYKIEKSAHVRAIAEKQKDVKLKKALFNRADLLLAS